MSIFKCKMCGGTIEFEPGASIGVCDSCGTKQTLPRLDDDRRANLYDRANHFRRNNEFDKAAGIYEQILNEDTTDAEAYWSLVLCRYGIEYVEDPSTHKRVPTVNRAQFTSIFADEDYKSAIAHADSMQRSIYEAEAHEIDEIQKGILAISQKEEPFDVFICYKETDANGRRTMDSVLANDLYHQLTQEGFKVFFSRITLEDKLGTAYEPYIFSALNSAKVMVVLGTKPEHFKAVWVKNEWSRYLALVKNSNGKKVLIPAYRDMDPYDLPDEFSHLQAQDMSKLGFMQDLIRGIKKIVARDESAPTVVQPTVVQPTAAYVGNTAPLLRRAFMFLEDGDWAKADDFAEQVLNIEPENAEAYVAKLMAELKVRNKEALPDCAEPFDESNNFKKAFRFGDKAIKDELNRYITQIKERNEYERLSAVYNNALARMNGANNEAAFVICSNEFESLAGFKDSDELAKSCLEKAEVLRKDAIYAKARSQMTGEATSGYEAAIKTFSTISGWKDADEQIIACQRKIEEIKVKEEAARIEQERKAEISKKRTKKIIAIVTPAVAACLAFVILLTTVIIPSAKYNAAVKLYESGKYEEAKTAFEAMEGYKDSKEQIINCKYKIAIGLLESNKYTDAYALLTEIGDNDAIVASKYDRAVALIDSGDYETAYALLAEIGNNDVITASKHDRAIVLLDSGDYETAYALLAEIGNNDAIVASKYDRAVALIDSGAYEEAYILLNGLNYKDSANIQSQCERVLISKAQVGDYVFFGSYEQDNNASNGIEPVEWLVLAKEEDRVLVISKYALDCQQYNAVYTDVTWETCSLRKWLNETFFNNAFSSDEQAMIRSTTVTADKNPSYNTPPGNNTTDKVFLLSIKEVNEFFGSDSARQCQGTAYCNIHAYKAGNGNCTWWLRSPGGRSNYAATVDESGRAISNLFIVLDNGGTISVGHGVNFSHYAVRPAIWIDLGS